MSKYNDFEYKDLNTDEDLVFIDLEKLKMASTKESEEVIEETNVFKWLIKTNAFKLVIGSFLYLAFYIALLKFIDIYDLDKKDEPFFNEFIDEEMQRFALEEFNEEELIVFHSEELVLRALKFYFEPYTLFNRQVKDENNEWEVTNDYVRISSVSNNEIVLEDTEDSRYIMIGDDARNLNIGSYHIWECESGYYIDKDDSFSEKGYNYLGKIDDINLSDLIIFDYSNVYSRYDITYNDYEKINAKRGLFIGGVPKENANCEYKYLTFLTRFVFDGCEGELFKDRPDIRDLIRNEKSVKDFFITKLQQPFTEDYLYSYNPFNVIKRFDIYSSPEEAINKTGNVIDTKSEDYNILAYFGYIDCPYQFYGDKVEEIGAEVDINMKLFDDIALSIIVPSIDDSDIETYYINGNDMYNAYIDSLGGPEFEYSSSDYELLNIDKTDYKSK